MEIQVETRGDVTIVRLAGPADATAVAGLRKTLDQCLRARTARIVCDLSGVDFICSEALGALIQTHLRAEKTGGRLCLVALQPRVAEVLATTQLNRLFAVHDSLDNALQGGRGPS